MRKTLILAVALCLACGPSVKFFPLNDAPDEVLAERIEVFTKTPERLHVEVGIVKVKARRFFSSPEKMMRRLKEAAQRRGGDAIVIDHLGSETSISGGVNKKGGYIRSSTRDVVQALVIAWE